MADLVLYKFQPDAMDRKILEHLFVGEKRKKQLTEMVNNIVESLKLKSPRHYLVIGQRGMGKTHFLTLLYYHLKDKLNEEEYKVVKLAEEEYSIYRVSDFLVRILEILREEIEWNELQKYDEDMMVEYLLEKLKEKGRGYVVLIENLDQILDKQMDKKEVKRLRAILQKEKLLWIVASSPVRFRGISEGSEPFYNFFEISYLNELNDEEIKELVEKLCELNNDNNAEAYIKKINIITKLTGGISRIVFVIYGLLREDVGGVEDILFKILDDYTPYYQDIFNTLSPQERLIFDTLISLNGIATPTEIAEKSRLERNTVSTVLKRLEKDGFVKSYRLGKIVKYEVKDILFRIWREVRKTPFGKKRISMLIEFLKLWYSLGELMDNLKKAAVKRTDLKRFLNVILEVEGDDVKHKVKNEEYDVLYKNGKYDEILKKAEDDLSLNPNDDIALLYKAIVFSDLGRFEESIKILEILLNIVKEDDKKITILNVLGTNLIPIVEVGEYDKAKECVHKILSINQNYNPAFGLMAILCIISALKELQNNNFGNAEKELQEFLKWYSNIHIYPSKEMVNWFIIGKVIYQLAQSKNIEAIKFLMDKLEENAELKELLKPVRLALDIVETKNKKLYYNVPQEIRKIVLDMVKLLTDSNKLIPKELIIDEAI